MKSCKSKAALILFGPLVVAMFEPGTAATDTIQVTEVSQMLDSTGTIGESILLKFDLPVDWEKVRIDRASLRIPLQINSGSRDNGFRIAPVAEDWSSTSPVLQKSDMALIDTASTVHFLCVEGPAMQIFDVTEVVIAWMEGGASNFGIQIQMLSEAQAGLAFTSESEFPPGTKAQILVWHSKRP